MTGDTMTVDGAAMKATLKTADGVFPVAVEAPEEAGGGFDGSVVQWTGTRDDLPPPPSAEVLADATETRALRGRLVPCRRPWCLNW